MNTKKSTPANPGDIVSGKPDKNKPWCPNCREHMRYKTTTKRKKSDEGRSYTVNTYSCRQCKGVMLIPSKLKVQANYGPPFLGILGWILHTVLTLAYCNWLQLKGPLFTPVVLGIPFLVWPVLAFYYWRWFRHASGYHSWLQWTNER